MIVEQMRGKIRLESSKIGEGTVFSFTIPTAKTRDNDQNT
jgi:signal transduction histidine kinase